MIQNFTQLWQISYGPFYVEWSSIPNTEQWICHLCLISQGVSYLIESQVKFKAIVCPRAEFQVADLGVKRKIGDVNWTRTFENSRRNPENIAITRYYSHGISLLIQSIVCTVKQRVFYL